MERATRGVRLAFDVVEGGVRQAARVGAGVKAGLSANCSVEDSTGVSGSKTTTPSHASKPEREQGG